MSESRVVHLETHAHLDGRNDVSVELTETPRGNIVVAVRPKGKRLVYKSLLSDVVRWLVTREPRDYPTPTFSGRIVHLSVSEDVDLGGQNEASVTLVEIPRDFLVIVRAKHQRTTYTGRLS